MPNIQSPTPAELKAARKGLGLTQVAFAEALGISRRTVEDWEAEKSTPPVYLRLAIAALFNDLPMWEVRPPA